MVVGKHRIVDGIRVVVAVHEPCEALCDSATTLASGVSWILKLEGEHVAQIIVFCSLRTQDILKNHAGVAQRAGGASFRN